MARSAPATQAIVPGGTVVAYTAPNSDGDVVDCGGHAWVEVKNDSGGAITVTIETPVTYNGFAVADNGPISVAAGTVKRVGPLRADLYARPLGGADVGKAYVNYSAVASVTRAVVSG